MPDDERPQKKLRMHPEMPRPNVPDDCNIYDFEVGRFGMASSRFTFGHVPNDRWERIFGKRK